MNASIRAMIFISLFLGAASTAQADGFVRVEQTIFGMDCAPCAYGMQKNLGKLPGVAKVDVSLEQGVAVIDFSPDSATTLAQIRDVVLHGGLTPDKAIVTLQGSVSTSEGKLLLMDGTGERYALTGLSAAQMAALRPGDKVVVKGEAGGSGGGTLELKVLELKTG